MKQAIEKTHYEVLGVAPSAAPEQIRAAYLNLAKLNHPDAVGGDGQLFAAVTEAYAVLKDQARRRAYDAVLAVLTVECPECEGAGVTYRIKGFTRREETPCAACEGRGRQKC